MVTGEAEDLPLATRVIKEKPVLYGKMPALPLGVGLRPRRLRGLLSDYCL